MREVLETFRDLAEQIFAAWLTGSFVKMIGLMAQRLSWALGIAVLSRGLNMAGVSFWNGLIIIMGIMMPIWTAGAVILNHVETLAAQARDEKIKQPTSL